MAGLPGWISVETASRRLGISKQRVYRLLAEGRLMKRELYGRVLVSSSSVRERLQAVDPDRLMLEVDDD